MVANENEKDLERQKIMLDAKVFRVFNPIASAIVEDEIYSLTDFFAME